MNTDRLGTALRELVDTAEEGLAPPAGDELWAGGRRRRRTAALVPVLAAACVAALAALLVWPTGAPRASLPAVRLDDGTVRLTTYPSAVPKPPFIVSTGRPGVTAAVVTEVVDTPRSYAASPGGAVTRLVLPEVPLGAASNPSLSPDGRWLARGAVLSDLERGVTVPSLPVRQGLSSTRKPPDGPAWWSPDSSRVYVDAPNQGDAKSSGIVLGTDGTMTEAPLLVGGSSPIVAGWLDDETVLAFIGSGDTTASLSGRTWQIGSPAWEVSPVSIEWPAESAYAGTQVTGVSVLLSPDASRLLLTRRIVDPETNVLETTQALLFDAATGSQLGMPGLDGDLSPSSWDPGTYAEWGGGGCRPAWRAGLPVSTDDGAVSILAAVPGGDHLVDVSSRYESPCVAFAGNDLRGTPAADTRAIWQERLWVWGGRLLVVAGVVWVVWLFTRRRSWRDGVDSQRPLMPFLPSRG